MTRVALSEEEFMAAGTTAPPVAGHPTPVDPGPERGPVESRRPAPMERSRVPGMDHQAARTRTDQLLHQVNTDLTVSKPLGVAGPDVLVELVHSGAASIHGGTPGIERTIVAEHLPTYRVGIERARTTQRDPDERSPELAFTRAHTEGSKAMADKILLEISGPIAVITNNNPEKRNAFDDDMDLRLFEILSELKDHQDVRAVIWRGEGKAWSSGRDVSVIGNNVTALSHHELMSRGHRGILQIFDLDVPIIVAIHGWAIGGSFQRALLCDIRIASEGTRFMLPEVGHGVIPDTGGVGRLFQICGTGVTSDLILTGRPMGVEEAFAHGIVSRVVAPERLDETAWEIANSIAAAPAVTVKMARRVLQHLSEPGIRSSMADELIYQTFINKSSDFAEMKAATADGRMPHYTGS